MASGEEETTWGDVEVGRPCVHSARSVLGLKRDGKGTGFDKNNFHKKNDTIHISLHQAQIKEEK